MLGKLIEFSIKNRFLIIFITMFILLSGTYSLLNTPLDAIPDLSDVQVIVMTEFPDQAPQVVEDQVTYPLTTAMLSVPGAKTVRGYSLFGTSFVYIIFEDGTDMYWARSRVLEYLNYISNRMPAGVKPTLGPDATGVGWVFEYAVVDKSGKLDLAQLRSIQDWFLRYELTSVSGVSEVASIGGFVKQYQVDVDPIKLLAYNITLSTIENAIKMSNNDVGGGLVEMSETEFMVRGLGYIKGIDDINNIALGIDKRGSPILVKDIANVHLGPELRRGLTELDGIGETVGGIVLMRQNENALDVIDRVKAKLAQLKSGLPEGVEIIPTYDRSGLIKRAVHTLAEKLIEESIVVAIVCIIFLLHFRSALVAILTLPVGILMAFIVLRTQGLNANIMSLGGIAIAIGVMIDAAIVMIEIAHKQIEHDNGATEHWELITRAAKQVGPALFFSLLIITTSFLPIFTLQGQEGRLFKPLAYTKTFAMAAAALLSVTLVPVMMGYFIRTTILPQSWTRRKQRIITVLSSISVFFVIWVYSLFAGQYTIIKEYGLMFAIIFGLLTMVLLLPQELLAEAKNPVNRFLVHVYRPGIRFVLRYKKASLLVSLLIALTLFPIDSLVINKLPDGIIKHAAQLISPLFPVEKIGGEFMPPLYEGDLLYMPSTQPGISIAKAREILQQTDKIIKSFPEVERVFGKSGRAETATDPAPLSMFETIIMLKPVEEWRRLPIARIFSNWPKIIKTPLSMIFPLDRYITHKELSELMENSLKIPGLTGAWTMPIKTRIDMLATGIKTPVGIKVMGNDLNILSEIGDKIETTLRGVKGTMSVYSEKVVGGYYLDYDIDRKAAARYGLTIGEIQDTITAAIGGMNVTRTVEGLERYNVSVRYGRELRDSLTSLKRILIATPSGYSIPITQVANIVLRKGPMMIKSENSRPSAWIYVDIDDTDIASYVNNAKSIIKREIKLPVGYTLVWSGQYEYMERANQRLKIVVPVTLLIIFFLLYLNFKNITESLIVMLSLPFAMVGGVWFIYLAGYSMSIAVWVGFIALAGVAAETGVIMLIYLDEALKDKIREKGGDLSKQDVEDAVMVGAVDRVRPKIMTVVAIMAGLLPLFWGEGAGTDTMRRIAAPMIGGMVSSTILTLKVIPTIYAIWKGSRCKN
jgi:Cu(I)/Ag(I) efflux system membrane protein CusA/SilA